MATLKRYDIKKLLANPNLRRRLIVESTRVTQAREDIEVSKEQVENSYYVVTEGERASFFSLVSFRTDAGEYDGRHSEFARSCAGIGKSRFDVALGDFRTIEDAPLAYDKLALVGHIFTRNPAMQRFGEAWQGVISRDDERYFRCFWEVSSRAYEKPWVTLQKGVDFCRFYYNTPLVIDWSTKAQSEFHRLRDVELYFREGLTWPRRTAKGLNVRYLPSGCVFGDKGPAFLASDTNDIWFLLAVTNSLLFEFLFRAKTSFSWEIGVMKSIPIPNATIEAHDYLASKAKSAYSLKAAWDTGNEISTCFTKPWVLQDAFQTAAKMLSRALDTVPEHEAALQEKLLVQYNAINEAAYRLYGVKDSVRSKIEAAIGERPPEIIWPQMEGKSTDQKRMEHVCRLLSYAVKCVVEEDNDGLVSLQSVAQELPLLERMRAKLASFFPEQDPHTLEIEIVNELKKRVKGYARAESLQEWLTDRFFDFHCDMYQQRPILWQLASSQDAADPAFSIIVAYHRFDHDHLAKLRSVHVRDRMTTLRREAAQAGKDNREDDRLQLLAALEEVEEFDRRLARLQEGNHLGAEGSDEDYRILTPWKKPSERPKGWLPDIDDGVKVNIAPLARAGLLRIKNQFGAKDLEDE